MTGTIRTGTDISTGTITYTRTLGTGTLQQTSCTKVGNIVNVGVRVYGISQPATGTWFQLPNGFIPREDVCISGTIQIGTSWYPLVATVSTTGTISINYSSGANAAQVIAYGSFPV